MLNSSHSLIFFLNIFTIFANERTLAATIIRSSKEKYVVNFLDEQEIGRISVQKCCPDKQILDSKGKCVEKDEFKPRLKEMMELKKRIIRATQEQGINGHIPVGFTVGFPKCQRNIRQLHFNISTIPEDLQFTSSFQFVTKAAHLSNHPSHSFIMVDPANYCIDWYSSDKIAVHFCLPDTCNVIIEHNDSTAFDPNGSKESFKNGTVGSHQSIKFSPSLASSASGVCLMKCCPPSKVFTVENFTCVPDSSAWQLYPQRMTSKSSQTQRMTRHKTAGLVYKDVSRKLTHESVLGRVDNDYDEVDDAATEALNSLPLDVTWLTGTLDCEQYEVYADKYDRYYINSDGLLITEQNGTVGVSPPEEYCFDVVREEEKEKNKKSTKNSIMFRQIAFVCFEEEINDAAANGKENVGALDKSAVFSWRILCTILTGISCVFLFLTCSVYGILRKDLNLPGWLQFAYAFSLLLTFTLLTMAQLWTQQIHDISKNLCKVVGYGLHFFFLSCFFWLTSMNLDLWLSFRNTVLVRGFGKSRGKRRFLEFAAFSIGFPAAITCLLLAADNCKSANENADATNKKGSFCVLPSSGIGENSCVVDSRNKVAQLHYFYGFVGILLLINLVIFVCTLISLRNRERETRLAKRQSTSNCDYDRIVLTSKSKTYKLFFKRLQLFTRLFLIMGVLWIFEVISWIFEFFYGNENVKEIFIFTDCLNASQGIAVFLMFVWKKQTWKQLKKKLKAVISGKHSGRPLTRPSYTCTVTSSGLHQHAKETSVKSSHLSSSTKSTDSGQIPSTSTTFSQLEFDH